MDSQTCYYCDAKLKRKRNKICHAKSFEEHKQILKEMEDLKVLLELKDQEIGELKKLNKDLNDQVLRKGSILVKQDNVENAKVHFKKACQNIGIKLSYDHRGNRIRHSFKSDSDSRYHRVNFKLLFSATTALENDADNLIGAIKTFILGVCFERKTESLQCEIKFEEGNYVIYYIS